MLCFNDDFDSELDDEEDLDDLDLDYDDEDDEEDIDADEDLDNIKKE